MTVAEKFGTLQGIARFFEYFLQMLMSIVITMDVGIQFSNFGTGVKNGEQ